MQARGLGLARRFPLRLAGRRGRFAQVRRLVIAFGVAAGCAAGPPAASSDRDGAVSTLSTSSEPAKATAEPVPAPPPPASPRVAQIVVARGRSCARLEDGTVSCWG